MRTLNISLIVTTIACWTAIIIAVIFGAELTADGMKVIIVLGGISNIILAFERLTKEIH